VLAVFRFWHVLEYWFPYRDLMEPDRVTILREFVPRRGRRPTRRHTGARCAASSRAPATRTRTSGARRATCHRATRPGRLERAAGDGAVGRGRFVVDGYASAAEGPASGLRPGDVLVRLDGASVDSLARAWAPDVGASNDASRRFALARALRRGRGGPVRVEVERDGRPLAVVARRWPAAVLDARAGLTHDRPGPAFQMLVDGRDTVAYLKLSAVVAADAADYVRRAAGARALVVDIRNYPRQFVVFALGAHLVPAPTPFARFTKGRTANPGAFAWTPPIRLPAQPPTFPGRVVILVDETSISQSEYQPVGVSASRSISQSEYTAMALSVVGWRRRANSRGVRCPSA
jgi:hypothetical protein